VEALEHAEQFFRIPQVEPCSVITHKDDGRLTMALDAVDFDDRFASVAGVLQSVVKKVL
jgi:hypothetical protein